MSEVPTSTMPKRQAIVDRLRQRIDNFRKHHDSCQARLEETQPSRELKQRQESKILYSKLLENKGKMNTKIRHDQVSNKIPKQEEINNVGQEKPTSNTGLQPNMKRRSEFPQSQIDGERDHQNNEEVVAPVSQKYQRFENQNDVHCEIKPPNFTGEGDSLPLQTNLPFPTVNGHSEEFPKSEELSNAGSSYSSSACANFDRTTRASQQYGGNFTSFTNRNQPSVSDNSRTQDFPVDFKQENGLLSHGNDGSTSIANGFQGSCTKSEDDFDNPKSKEEDLESQISQFERVLAGIKNRDGNSNDCESKSDLIAQKKQPLQPQNPPSGNGLTDSVSHDGGKGSNQLGLSNGPNNGTQLPSIPVTSSTPQPHGISRATAEALQQFVIAQKEERLATRNRYEKSHLNAQGVGREQNSNRMTPRPSNFPPIRQRVYEQIQQRITNQKSKIHVTQIPQLHARSPVNNPLGSSSGYQIHPKVRYRSVSPSSGQPITFPPNTRVQQNLMPQVHHSSSVQQHQPRAQIQNVPRHQINMYVQQQQQQQQQKIAYQQRMATRLPSYSQTQRMTHSSSMMDIRQNISGVHSSHSAQYALPQQVTRNPQPLPHLQHYPAAYSNQGALSSRPSQPALTSEYSGYQNPYGYNSSQDNKLHSAYQRHVSIDDTLASSRYLNQDLNSRNNYPYQRSSSLPGGAKNVFNQTSPPVVRLALAKQNIPDMNNNGNEHQNQELSHIHPQQAQQPPLTHLKPQHVSQTNSMTINQEQQPYQRSALLSRGRSQTANNLQRTFSSSFSNLLDLKSSSESSLFPFFGQESSGGSTENADFESLLKSPPSDFDLLNILESEPPKALQ